MRRTLLFDLDDTLMVEGPAAAASFEAAAQFAEAQCGVDAKTLAISVRERARELWYAAPTHDYCMRVGISSWEGLWCQFEGEGDDLQRLREWSPSYRHESWRLALSRQDIDDAALASTLAERFVEERRARHEVFPDAAGALADLEKSHALALVTNGASCLQREKLHASGLSDHFNVVVVSGDLGVAKPDRAIFEHVLAELDTDPRRAVMIGDSIIKDVEGARAAGLGAIWVNRGGAPAPPGHSALVEVQLLSELREALDGLPSVGLTVVKHR
jgi:putative hydrolase of the HAD superfamily